ncbi:P2Y purinoceptor 1-like [Meleagris gallopavo]|uniref:P2Y purinoceptor 1-like n=1 Tax=Meleagris gallopavo TaxID=9103 RepID=UPI000549C0D9|nr:P2Y purinoceptor 1-like [Meleagris gallopavo]
MEKKSTAWNLDFCKIDDGNISKIGLFHGKMTNDTCAIFICNNHPKLEWYCYLLILVCLFTLIVGFLGNILALRHYVYCVKTWTTNSIFLFNLALCDLAWILMAPFSVYHSLQKSDNYLSQTFFYIVRLFFSINIYGSVYFLTLISFDRYLGAVHPITSLTWWNKGKAMFCTAAVWIFIVLASVPEIFCTIEAGRQHDNKNSQDDIGEHLQFEVPFILSKIVLRFLIPVTVIFTCYMLTLKALLQLCKRQQRRNRIIRPLLLISAAMIVFAVSFTPYHIMMMVIIIYKTCCQPSSESISTLMVVYQITEIICSINSCLDPIIFTVANKTFYQKIKNIKCHPKCQCCCCLTHRVRDIALSPRTVT